MIKKLTYLILVIVAGVCLVAALEEPQMEIAREIVIRAVPEKIFPYLNNSQKMGEWMPWKDSDPQLVMNYSGPTEGVGSRSSWNSKGSMGTGTAEITESISNQSVRTKLQYTRPMTMSQIATLTLQPLATGETKVRWSVSGENSFVFRLVGIFFSMDKIVGAEFEKGLAKLKTVSEL